MLEEKVRELEEALFICRNNLDSLRNLLEIYGIKFSLEDDTPARLLGLPSNTKIERGQGIRFDAEGGLLED